MSSAAFVFLFLYFRVPPNIYKKVKALPESQQDAALEEELESMLKKHGLSKNSSEKGADSWVLPRTCSHLLPCSHLAGSCMGVGSLAAGLS